MLDSKSVQLNYCVETALDDIYNILHSKDDKAIFNFKVNEVRLLMLRS